MLAGMAPTISASKQLMIYDNNIENNEQINKTKSSSRATTDDQMKVEQIDVSSTPRNNEVVFKDVETFDYSTNTLAPRDYKFEFKGMYIDDYGLHFPKSVLYNSNPADDAWGVEYVPLYKVLEGKSSVEEYILYRHNFESAFNQKNTYNNFYNNFLSQINNGSDGIYFNISNTMNKNSSNKIDLVPIEPMMIHLTWNPEFDNGLKNSKKQVYYKGSSNDKLILKLKSRKWNNKMWGGAESPVNSFSNINISNFLNGNIKIPKKNKPEQADVKLKLSVEFGRYDKSRMWFLGSNVNLLTNTLQLFNWDFSKNKIKLINKQYNSPNTFQVEIFNYYYDISFHLWIDVSDVALNGGYTQDDIIKWAGDINEYNLETKYPIISFYSNNDSIFDKKRFTKIGGDYYLSPLEEISFQPRIYPSESKSTQMLSQYTLLYNFMRENNFTNNFLKDANAQISNSFIFDVVNNNSHETYRSFYGNTMKVIEKPNFMSNKEIFLLIMTILSLITLILVIVKLTRTSGKEDEGVIIKKGGDE